MKTNVNETNQDYVRRMLINPGLTQPIAISDEDVDSLFDSTSAVRLQISRGDTLGDALRALDPQSIDGNKATKAIIAIRTLPSYDLPVGDLSELTRYIGANLPLADVRWGMATVAASDSNVTVIAVTAR